jgi:LytS/YehU family sensor histidine kinase
VLSLVREDPAACENMILSLTHFLRKTLEDEDRALVPLERELAVVLAYLDVERHRFPDRFACEIVADEEARRQLVPALLLQPLVENAVRHGFSGVGRRGLLRIVATVGSGRLHLSVQDDGAGAEAAPAPGHGLGLSVARERLSKQFGETATFEAGPRASGGFQVLVSFPAVA